MAEVQKQGKPTDRQADEWEQDLHPHAGAVRNHGFKGTDLDVNLLNAYDLKDVHRFLDQEGFQDLDLKQILLLPNGSRLEQGATYVDLKDPERQEFTAMGGMEATAEHWYVPKAAIDYQLWNRLTKVDQPARTGEGN